jgi:hypothetical protein
MESISERSDAMSPGAAVVLVVTGLLLLLLLGVSGVVVWVLEEWPRRLAPCTRHARRRRVAADAEMDAYPQRWAPTKPGAEA